MTEDKIRSWDAYLVIGLFGYGEKSSLEIVKNAITGGVKVVQVREKKISDAEFIRLAGPIRDLCRAHMVDFIVNDRVHAAVELDAEGLHVGQDDMPGREAREWIGDRILGISASSLDEARLAISEQADYLGVGSIYPTTSKADAGEAVGTQLIEQIRGFSSIPIVGIGGINLLNAAEVIRAGADSAAVISAICYAGDPILATKQLSDIIQVEKNHKI